jgi:hypothetical protein
MDRNQPFSEPTLPADIVKLALGQHAPVIRLAYMEIASGINRLLRRGIPTEGRYYAGVKPNCRSSRQSEDDKGR